MLIWTTSFQHLDYDECSGGAPCSDWSDAKCINTYGAFRCICQSGYYLEGDDGGACTGEADDNIVASQRREQKLEEILSGIGPDGLGKHRCCCSFLFLHCPSVFGLVVLGFCFFCILNLTSATHELVLRMSDLYN